METPTTFELDGDSLAYLVSLCDKLHITPSDLISEAIREEAYRNGLATPPAKSA